MNEATQTTETQAKLADELDKALLEGVRDGTPIVVGKDKEGFPIVEKMKTAAWLNVARQRVKDLGVSALPTEENNAGKLIKELKENGSLRLAPRPDLDIEQDDRATA